MGWREDVDAVRRIAREPGRPPQERGAMLRAAAALERMWLPPEAVDPAPAEPDVTEYGEVVIRRFRRQAGIATAAVWLCSLCSGVIDGMGGPGQGETCGECARDLRRNALRGAVIREPAP